MSKQEIKLKGNLEAVKAAEYLSDLAASMKSGSIYIQKGGEFVNLKPFGSMEFEIEAKRKKHKEKITIELSWSRNEKDEIEDEDLKIASPDQEKKA
jgi:amphi-Trp domain-containing protein